MEKDITLNPEYKLYTPKGDPNLIWAISKYFVPISEAHGVSEESQILYLSDYNNTICPAINPGIPAAEYDSSVIDQLFDAVISTSGISAETFQRRHRHLIIDPIEWFFASNGEGGDPAWGAFYRFDDKGIGKDAALALVQRSFSDSEASILKRVLLSAPEHISGELAGLSICEYAGARLNEAAGLNYANIIKSEVYRGEYRIMIGAVTTTLHRNTLKASGKTRNAPRIIPLLDVHAKALLTRMRYIEKQMVFPYEDENGIFQSVFDLPIACRGSCYTKRCSADNLSKAGTELFQHKLKFSENRMAGLNQIVLHTDEIYTDDKSATSYTCRRDYATELDNAFICDRLHSVFLQYSMGHEIRDKRYRRNDLTDEFYLHAMKRLLEKSHRVNKL